MNNLTFGNARMGYYETIAGGSGAGSSWHGRSGVHTHMTNTRITDPEILERRFPVVLQQFSLRRGALLLMGLLFAMHRVQMHVLSCVQAPVVLAATTVARAWFARSSSDVP